MHGPSNSDQVPQQKGSGTVGSQLSTFQLSISDLMKASTLGGSYEHTLEVEKPDRRVVASNYEFNPFFNPHSESRN